MYVLCENFLASSLVCIRYISKFVHQAKINYKDLKDRQPAGKIQLGRNMLSCSHFCYEILCGVMNIKEKWNSILTGCALLSDRVVFASMLHVFMAKREQEERHFWLTRGFILFPSSTASSWQSSLHLKEICRSLEKSVFKHSISSVFKGRSMLLISHCLKECGIPYGSCGKPSCNILRQRGQRSSDKVYHYCALMCAQHFFWKECTMSSTYIWNRYGMSSKEILLFQIRVASL